MVTATAIAEVPVNPFNKLPGFQRSPAGLEWALWRRLPALLGWGTALPLLLALALHLLAPPDADAASQRALQTTDYMLAGVVMLHWTLLLTVAIGCLIVMAMKGPAYMADAFPPDVAVSDSPVPEMAQPERPPRRRGP